MIARLERWMTGCKHWFLSEKGVALVMIVTGALFIALGIYRFWLRPEHFTLLSFLGCVVGAWGAFFLLLITDYVLHHARLVFIPWFISLIYFSFVEPHLAVGLGLALWYMLASQLRG
jgi:hypothetical protein